jgi:hypothetical protein
MHVYTFHQVEGPNKFLFRNYRHIVKGRANPLQVISSYEGWRRTEWFPQQRKSAVFEKPGLRFFVSVHTNYVCTCIQ